MDPQSIINSLFMQHLGRQPTPAEMQGFQSALQSGVTDATGLSLFLQGSSQYQQAQIPGQVQQFQNTLGQSNQNILSQGFDKAQQQFALQGRPNSTGLGSQFAQVSGNLAAQQSPQVAQFQGGLQQNALNPNQYGQNYLNNQQNVQNQNWQNSVNNLNNQNYGNFLGQNLNQANKNQATGLIGAGIGAIGSLGGGYLARR